MEDKKKSSDDRRLQNIILTTAIIKLIHEVINLVDKLLN